MRRSMRVELIRAFANRALVLALAAGVVLALIHVALVPFQYAFAEIWERWRSGAGGSFPPSLYSSWIGQTPQSVVTAVFFYSVPLLACIPFADSLCTELGSRYAIQGVSRTGRMRYFASKSIAVASSSAAVVLVPLALNLFLTACLVPTLPPQPSAGTFYVAASSMLADLYYAAPGVHIVVFLALICLFSAAFGLVSAAASFFVSNRFVVVLLPFALCMVANFALQGTFLAGFSPLNMMLPYQPFPSVLGVVVAVLALLWGAALFTLWFKGRSFEDI